MGDPFEEKRLIEACLELLDTKLVVGIQDLGGAGLACATSETAGRGGVGMDVDVTAVPRREEGMEPWEVMTSESQERMLAIVTPESWPAVAAICAKWEVRASVIGTVTEPGPDGGGRLRIRDGMDGPVLADVPAASLSDDAPLYDRPRRAPAPCRGGRRRRRPPTAPATCSHCCARPRWVYRQYDHQLFLNTVVGPGGDAALLRLAGPGLPHSSRGVALTTDSNPRACALDPRAGTALVLAEGVANLACVGATPVAVVNCLNFGNPEHPRSCGSSRSASTAWPRPAARSSLPVIGGNVSLYNESGGADIDPTPVLGVLGLVDDLRAPPPGAAWSAGDTVLLLGARAAADGSLPAGGDALGHRAARPPHRQRARGGLRRPRRAVRLRRRARGRAGRRRRCGAVAGAPLVGAVHDVSGGGLAVALAEMAAAAGTGCVRRADRPGRALHRAAVALRAGHRPPRRAAGPGRRPRHPDAVLGRAGGDRFVLEGLVDLPVAALGEAARAQPGRGPGRPVTAQACARMGGA